MATVTFEDASRIYANGTRPAVDKLNLELADGEFMVLVGPSGCGKTTSLRMLAGLEDIDEGTIRIGTHDVAKLPARERDVAMVFQNYALYPHMDVAENMGFALKIARLPKAEITARVRDAAKILDLEPYLKRKPRELSGGQRQRVAMGRAIVRQPQVFLMDEPLSNLDAKLRVATRGQIASLQRRLGVTTLYVTHDQVEAMTMGDRVAVMRDGILQQCDTPRALYAAPANAFVAGFIGSPPMNLLKAITVADGVQIGNTFIRDDAAELTALGGDGQPITVGVRPECLSLVPAGEGMAASVDVVEELGAEAFLYARLASGSDAAETAGPSLIARIEPRQAPARGTTIHLRIRGGSMLFFDPTSGARIVTGAGPVEAVPAL